MHLYPIKRAILPLVISMMFYTATSSLSYAENIDLPDIGSTADAILSIEEEKRLGKAFMRSVRQYFKIVDDPLINNYIQSLGTQLTSHIEGINFDFNFFVVDAPDINAFAGPGGNIGINSGTILATESESELASVLAHEIAHVTQRHLQRSFEKANKMNLPTAAAVIAAILLGSKNIEAGEALLVASVANSAQAQINFTRANEHEADRVGMQLLTGAGFDPRAMPVFFERLQKNTRMYANVVPEFLSTHPITINRISDSRNRAEQYPIMPFNDSASFYILQSSLQAKIIKNPNNLSQHFHQTIKSGNYKNKFAQQYGLTLAHIANEEYAKARLQIESLIKEDHERVPYLLTRAKIEIKEGKLDKATSLLANALKLYPHNTALIIYYAKTLLGNKQTEASKKMLQEQIRHNPSTPSLYQLLAKAETQLGNNSAAYQALAEYDYLYARTHLAINHLETALRQSDNSKSSRSRIEDRIKELKAEALLEQQLKEK